MAARVERCFWLPGVADLRPGLGRAAAAVPGAGLQRRAPAVLGLALARARAPGRAATALGGLRLRLGRAHLALDMARYNPMSYHNGSVWPHDVALCAAGMARQGERDGVSGCWATCSNGVHFGLRLPELFCGFDRAPGEAPVYA